MRKLTFAKWLTLCTTLPLLFVSTVCGQVIHQEGFNDDGDGTRYVMSHRGQLIGPDGPGAWDHNFLVDAIGLPSSAPAKRAAILWTDNAEEIDFTEDSLAIWDNLVSYMIDDKADANIGILGDLSLPTLDFLAFRWEDAGHTIVPIAGGEELPAADGLDLVIHSASANPQSPTDFVDYPVPLITYSATNHDDTLISSIGAPTLGGPTTVTVNDEFQDHPVLDGRTGEIQWVDEFLEAEPLQGIGGARPAGGQVLATYVDPATSLTLPALLLVDEGDDLLGAFAPVPEGAGYIVGGDLNLDLGGGDGAPSPENPASLTLNPIDVTGQTGVKLAIDLAATTVDYEPNDFLRILIANDEDADFTTVAEFVGLDNASSQFNKSLYNDELGALQADAFRTFEFDVPDDATNLVVRVEAFSTFPNEVLGFDNIVVFVPSTLDCNGDGVADVGDFTCSNEAGITEELLAELNLIQGDLDGQGGVAFPDFLILSANFGSDTNQYALGDLDGTGGVAFPDFLILSGNFGKTAAGTAAVPEPSGLALCLFGLLALGRLRRRR